MKRLFQILAAASLALSLGASMTGCAPSAKMANPTGKYAPEALQKDFDLMQEVLEKFHPSLYWYTSKPEMDSIFKTYRGAIRDSMTQQQFGFSVIAPVTTSIRCGHTSFSYSKSLTRLFRGAQLPSFPLYLKIWKDTMVVIENRFRKDSIFKRGTLVTSVNGMDAQRLTEVMFRYMPTDGYAQNINYIRLSAAFPFYHRNIFGLSREYTVSYLDSLGQAHATKVPLFQPGMDTLSVRKARPAGSVPVKKISRKERLLDTRSLQLDSLGKTAVMNLESFDNGFQLKKFYRQSFRTLHKKGIEHLVIDIRNNGGGKVDNYTALSRYLKDRSFRVADTAFALRNNFRGYGRYFQANSLNWVAMKVFARKRPDGTYHFRYWEKHVFKPRRKHHFDGQVYLVISGPTFSASTLFCNTMKGQSNVTLVGEETGGGAYGNSGLIIPYVTLPHTGIRVRMPLFRLVQFQDAPKTGRGVTPDVYVGPTVDAVTRGKDLKMEMVRNLIRDSREMAGTQSRAKDSLRYTH